MSREAASAARLLAKDGELVAFTAPGTPAFDLVTGEPIPGGGTTGMTYAVHAYPGRYTAAEVDGTTVQSSDIRLTAEVFDVRPAVGWDVAVDGKTYRVMDVRAVRKGGRDVVTICQLRAS